MDKIAVCIISGGMDSALASKIAQNEGYNIVAVHFNYGQLTQTKELDSFRKIISNIDILVKSYEIDLPFFTQIGASSLIDKNIEVPIDGLSDNIPSTYVPFRNGIFLSIASAIAEKHNATAIFIGVVEEDSSGYPDCKMGYIKQMTKAINLGTKDTTNIDIKMPLVSLSKADIVQKSINMGVDLSVTWSCYRFEDMACGVCDSCRLRLNGFNKVGLIDPIKYIKG